MTDAIDTAAAHGVKLTDGAAEKVRALLSREGREDLRLRHRGDLQGLARRGELRLFDRSDCIALRHFHHHVDHHAKPYSCPGDRGYGGAVFGGIVWLIRTALAIYSRLQLALARDGNGSAYPVGCGIGL